MRMPFAPQAPADDRRLLDYVLGLLPEEQAERLDEASIADDAVAARLRSVEDDLVDAYVRGALHGDTLRRFDTWYLASPRRRERVAFARSFTLAVDRSAASGAVTAVASDARRGAWRLGAVAAVLLFACAALAWQTLRLGRGITAAEQARQALDRRAHTLQQQVSDLTQAATEAARVAERPPVTSQAPAIALVLMPQTRAVGPVPALRVPPRAARVVFELRLDAAGPGTYQIGLRDPAINRVVWRSGWMAASGASLTVAVPAGLLKPQHYSLDVFARGPAGDADVAGSYAFEIAAP